MGVDFIREQAGKPWTKRWDKGLNRLKVPGLFDIEFVSEQRRVTVELDGHCGLKVGDNVIVEYSGDTAIVSSGYRRVGFISSVPCEVGRTISGGGGAALGIVERVGLFGNSAELSIR